MNRDGEIDFIGRCDRQVKIRGFRIELGDIEHSLISIPGVRKSYVKPEFAGHNVKGLLAYVEMDDKGYDESLIKKELSSQLPKYMIPRRIYQVDEMPLNNNGKVDVKQLKQEVSLTVVEPEIIDLTHTEQTLVNVVSLILGTERNILKENYYDLGGDSIKAIQIVSKIREEGFEIKTADILKSDTLADIALLLESTTHPQENESVMVEKYQNLLQAF